MKKFNLILGTIIFTSILISCGGLERMAKAYDLNNQVHLGMSIKEFKEIARSQAELESMESGYTVYTSYNYATEEWQYYYFKGQYLSKVDNGEFKAQRYEIKIITEEEKQ